MNDASHHLILWSPKASNREKKCGLKHLGFFVHRGYELRFLFLGVRPLRVTTGNKEAVRKLLQGVSRVGIPQYQDI